MRDTFGNGVIFRTPWRVIRILVRPIILLKRVEQTMSTWNVMQKVACFKRINMYSKLRGEMKLLIKKKLIEKHTSL